MGKLILKTTIVIFSSLSFDSLDAVREFAGEDYEEVFLPEKARRLLSRFAALGNHG